MSYCRFLFSMLLASNVFAQTATTVHWESAARYRQPPRKAIPGTITFTGDGVEFNSAKFSHKWPYREIQTFDLTGSRELTIAGYENRHWHEPGERRFRFTLANPLPPETAAAFTALVGRPSIDGDPVLKIAAIAELPAHRRQFIGGSNGTLRLRQGGIDYVSTDSRASRSWRWSDIRTIANPDPWEFRITGYRETVEFDLKEPFPAGLFDRLWNILYAKDLNVGGPQ